MDWLSDQEVRLKGNQSYRCLSSRKARTTLVLESVLVLLSSIAQKAHNNQTTETLQVSNSDHPILLLCIDTASTRRRLVALA